MKRAERILGPLVTARRCRKKHHTHQKIKEKEKPLRMSKGDVLFPRNPKGTCCDLENKDAFVSHCAVHVGSN